MFAALSADGRSSSKFRKDINVQHVKRLFSADFNMVTVLYMLF